MLPAITVAISAMPVVFGVSLLAFRRRLALQWHVSLEWMTNPSTLMNELDHADHQIRVLAIGDMAAATLAGTMALVLSLYVAKSAYYECEFMAAPTLANKGESDTLALSFGVGSIVCVGLGLGLAPWWRRFVATFSSKHHVYYGIIMEKNMPMHPLKENCKN